MKVSNKLTEIRLLNEDWSQCTRCPLGLQAFSHVLYELSPKGILTSVDYMVIGEGPGESEDTLGRPFIGRAGSLLRETLNRARSERFSGMLTNLLACRPTTEDGFRNRPPAESEIVACAPRLEGLLRIYQPKVVIAVGRIPEQYVPMIVPNSGYSCKVINTYHPSYILRQGGLDTQLGIKYIRFFIQAFRELETNGRS
jgi:uracil-DNA glycosylase family 4